MPAPPRPLRPIPRRARPLLALALAVACSSCVLAEGSQYVVQPAPPNGVHVTLRPSPTRALALLSDLVARGTSVDRALAARGYRISCDHRSHDRRAGDRCAFEVLRATPVRGGLLQQSAARFAWRTALAGSELGDFSSDALGAVRRHHGGCAHVTIRRFDALHGAANWTWRAKGSRGC